MRRLSLALGMGLAIALGACAAEGDNQAAAATDHASPQLATIPLTITQGTTVHRFTVEVARTPEEQSRGLMFRTALAADRGMLFPYDPPRYASFWMRNTLIPLDMIFVRSDGTIDRIAENTVPRDETPVASGGQVVAVLELAGGSAARLGIDEGATVRWTDR
jgi:uncharacterized protein